MKTRKSRKGGTKTSSFGSPGRINHDATSFYSSKLYEGLPKEQEVRYEENAVPLDSLDKIYCGSSENMEQLPDNSIHLMVTSPPYNVGKEYDENLTLEEYREFLKRVWEEVYRVLVPGGRVCINLANLGRKPYIPLHAFVLRDMLDLGFLMRGEIIWNKASSASPSTAWGSWLSAANPTLRDIQNIFWFFPRVRSVEKTVIREGTQSRKRSFLRLPKAFGRFRPNQLERLVILPLFPWSFLAG